MLAITIRFDQNTFYNADIYRIAHMKRNSIPILDQDIAKMSNAYESDKPPLTWTSCRPGRIWVKISSVTRWHPLALFDKVKVFCQPILYWILKLWSGESNADGIDNLKFERLCFLWMCWRHVAYFQTARYQHPWAGMYWSMLSDEFNIYSIQ